MQGPWFLPLYHFFIDLVNLSQKTGETRRFAFYFVTTIKKGLPDSSGNPFKKYQKVPNPVSGVTCSPLISTLRC